MESLIESLEPLIKKLSVIEEREALEEFTRVQVDHFKKIKPQNQLKRIFSNPLPLIFYLLVLYICYFKLPSAPLYIRFVGLLLGLYLIDFLSGIAHLILDTHELNYSKSRSFLDFLSIGFQYHHFKPNNWSIEESDLYYYAFSRTGMGSLMVTLVVFLFPLFFNLVSPQFYPVYMWTSLVVFTCAPFIQFTHAAAHGRWRGTWFNLILTNLQTFRLILPPEDHNIHHREFDINFCIFNGWANPLVNLIYKSLDFFNCLSKINSQSVQKAVYLDKSTSIPFPFMEIFSHAKLNLLKKRCLNSK